MARALEPVISRLNDHGVKLDKLTADHVTRADLDSMRRDMGQRFDALGPQFMTRELAETRFKTLEDDVKGLRESALSSQSRILSLISISLTIIMVLYLIAIHWKP